jgi:hypothetical protein
VQLTYNWTHVGVRWRARDTGIVELTLFVEGRVRTPRCAA